MAEEFDGQVEDFDDGEDGPDLRQVLRNGAPYGVFNEDGEAIPSWSAPSSSNIWGVVTGAEGHQLPLSFTGFADDEDIPEVPATNFWDK